MKPILERVLCLSLVMPDNALRGKQVAYPAKLLENPHVLNDGRSQSQDRRHDDERAER